MTAPGLKKSISKHISSCIIGLPCERLVFNCSTLLSDSLQCLFSLSNSCSEFLNFSAFDFLGLHDSVLIIHLEGGATTHYTLSFRNMDIGTNVLFDP